jgi:hypothetical protein
LEEAAYRALSDYEALREKPTLSVSPLHVEPDDTESPIESHDVYLRIGDLSLLVNISADGGFAWSLHVPGQPHQGGSREALRETSGEGVKP